MSHTCCQAKTGNDVSERQLPRVRLALTVLATLAELANLAWEHFNGGVVSHHILDRSDLPAISNGWGALLVPVLTWFLIGRIQRRIALRPDAGQAASRLPLTVVVGFVVALLFGILIAICFTHGYETVLSYLFPGMVVLALLLPAYRAECVLGFALGMTLTFGAVLPTVIATIITIASALTQLWIYPLVMRQWAWLKKSRSTTT